MMPPKLLRGTLGLIAAVAFGAFSFLAAAPNLTPTPDNPETALPAKKIVKKVQIVFVGPTSVNEARIRANMSTHEGGPYNPETIEKDIKNLYATGAVQSVDVTTLEVPGGVNMVVTITSRGVLGDIKFVGNSVITSKSLKGKTELKIGDPAEDAKLFAAQNKIRKAYTDKAYGDVKVQYKTEPMDKKGFIRVIYTIIEGEKG